MVTQVSQASAMGQTAQATGGMMIHNPLAALAEVDATFGIAMVDGKQQVLFMPMSATGVMICGLTPEKAEEWAANLTAAARQARTGLVIPQGSTLPGLNGMPGLNGIG